MTFLVSSLLIGVAVACQLFASSDGPSKSPRIVPFSFVLDNEFRGSLRIVDDPTRGIHEAVKSGRPVECFQVGLTILIPKGFLIYSGKDAVTHLDWQALEIKQRNGKTLAQDGAEAESGVTCKLFTKGVGFGPDHWYFSFEDRAIVP